MQASARLSSSAAFRKVIAGVSTATARSCYRTSRGKAHAAPLPEQEPPPNGRPRGRPKGRKTVTKQERKARIMEFVDNYRASNEGKLPSISITYEEVGGCYYIVRELFQQVKHNHAKSLLDNPEPAPLLGKVEVIDQPMPKVDARVDESQEILQVPEHPSPKDDAEVAQLQVTVQVSDHSFPKDEEKVAQYQATFQLPEHPCGKTTKHDMDTAADAPALSDQTHRERMKDLTDNPDTGNQQREIEDNKFDLKDSEKTLNTNDSNGSDQSGGDMVNEAKTHTREDNPKHEESANTGLLGSLKSFAYGIRNFWKNM